MRKINRITKASLPLMRDTLIKWSTFIDAINFISELSGRTDIEKLHIIKLKLTDSALQYSRLDDRFNKAAASDEFCKTLIERFGDSLPDQFYLERLASIRRQYNVKTKSWQTAMDTFVRHLFGVEEECCIWIYCYWPARWIYSSHRSWSFKEDKIYNWLLKETL